VDKASQREDKPLEITIKSDDAVEFKKNPNMPPQQVPMSQIGQAMKAAQEGDENKPVVISADESVKYKTVVSTMNQLNRAGIKRVGLAVRTDGGKR